MSIRPLKGGWGVKVKYSVPNNFGPEYFERVARVELVALGLGSRCSTTELHPQDAAPSRRKRMQI